MKLVTAFTLFAALALGGCAGGRDPATAGGTGSDQSPAQGAGETGVAPMMAARVYFAPVAGAADSALVPLARRLAIRATDSGIALAADNAGASFTLKGYFSIETFQGRTVVHYVWDVLDASGARVHRIQGQEDDANASAEGWQSVSDATMEVIADRTGADLAGWMKMVGR